MTLPRLTHLPFHPPRARHLTVRVQFSPRGSYLSVETGRGQWTVSC